ncbi:hypothetical protein WKT22_01494 [Candidatus Lokiarchaeum ossiferum]
MQEGSTSLKQNGMKNMSNKFYQMMKKRGFSETLKVLGAFDKQEAVQSKFFEKFEESESYYNAYLRVKKNLLESQLIKFKLNDNNEKVIYLTDKGKEVLQKMEEIEELIG